MKGKRIFSTGQDKEIMRLLINLRKADRPSQKRIRDTLRDVLGFYITDFTRSSKGFTVDDYTQLKKTGEITIK